MGTLLTHPFFKKQEEVPEDFLEYLTEIKHEREVRRYLLKKGIDDKKQAQLMKSNIMTIPRLGFENQLKIVASTSELIKGAFDPMGLMTQRVPFCYIVLPYALRRDNDGKLSSANTQGIKIAKYSGARSLELCKTCHFVTGVSQSLQISAKEKVQHLHQ